MKDFEIKGTVRKEDIPESKRGAKKDFTELFEKFDRISDGNSIHVVVQKKHHVVTISNAFKKKYGKSKASITQRNTKGSEAIDVYIIRN